MEAIVFLHILFINFDLKYLIFKQLNNEGENGESIVAIFDILLLSSSGTEELFLVPFDLVVRREFK